MGFSLILLLLLMIPDKTHVIFADLVIIICPSYSRINSNINNLIIKCYACKILCRLSKIPCHRNLSVSLIHFSHTNLNRCRLINTDDTNSRKSTKNFR